MISTQLGSHSEAEDIFQSIKMVLRLDTQKTVGFQQLEAPVKNLDLFNEAKYSHMNSTGSILGTDIHILQKD